MARMSCVPSYLLNFNASSSSWQQGLLQPPSVQSHPTPSDLKLGKKGTFLVFAVQPQQLLAEAAAPCKGTLQVLDLNKVQEALNPMDKQKYQIPPSFTFGSTKLLSLQVQEA